MVLVDSGSTHRFVDVRIIKELRFPVIRTTPMQVTVANGSSMLSQSVCERFSWKMHGLEFSADLTMIDLGVCDVVLGMDWMTERIPVLFDYGNISLLIKKDGKQISLPGIKEDSSLKMISVK